MKKSIQLVAFFTILMSALSAYSQKYKSVEDTGKLNLEYVKVSNDIADLTAELTAAQNKLPDYQAKANSENSSAQNAASSSSDQAAEATNGSVKEAKQAKRKAKKAYKQAKDARSATNNVKDQEDKIKSLESKLDKKRGRLLELDEMRASINAKL